MDDEPLIGNLIRAAFPNADVEAFVNPEAAMARLTIAPFDFIFCDLTMPRMSGIELFENLREKGIDLSHRFALITGSIIAPAFE